ncbi:hypothetical protein BCR34DRAFT_578391 [Clohesyomyces aquaticus]|uniref:Uncharacterized protein n=1 Tax=Clohesyomyces aquaticus TaxID=1231657 RepID=A0A1Y1YGT2_9PLEO|nr:hypothetical protein BCR34DRAFT_578391 [Clohesyomyces aquaticus]
MKTASAVLFAGVAAASKAYTTIYPCPDCPTSLAPPACTVTKQYQPVSTCSVYGKTTSCSTYAYVSTVLSDYDGHNYTVTKTDQPVTVYHTTSTITHTELGYATPSAYATGGYYNANGTSSGAPYPATPYATPTKIWNEKYEKYEVVPYNEMGPHALPGYGGSHLCGEKCHGPDKIKYQPKEVKECYGGKCATYAYIATYGVPKPSVTTYATPGIYTISSYDMTIADPTTMPAEATYVAHSGEAVTYGGMTTSVDKPTTITAPYAVYTTKSKTVTSTIIYTTYVCPHAGKYTVVKPTTTSYSTEHTLVYPTTTEYLAGVYHHTKETVTITKSNEPYTCHYHDSSVYPTTTPAPYGTTSVSKDSYPTGSSTSSAAYPDPSSDYEEPAENYGTPYAGYVKRGGMLERRKPVVKAAAPKVNLNKRVILV